MKLFEWLLGPMISRYVMPAQRRQDEYQEVRSQTQKGPVLIQQKIIDSSGGAKINVSEFTNQNRNETKNKTLIIFSVGNGDGYERDFEFYIKMARLFPNTQVAAFNFRNVCASTGKVSCEQDWIDDAKAVVMHYRNQGYKNKNILICGHSLGAAISTMMAAQVYAEDQEQAEKTKSTKKVESLRLINNRSLANLVEVIMIGLLGKGKSSLFNSIIYGGLAALGAAALGTGALMALGIGSALGVVTGFYGWVHPRICFDLLRPWMSLASYVCFGRLDAFRAYQKIPNENKDYLVAKNESVTTKHASMHSYLKPERDKKQRKLVKEISQLERIICHEDQALIPKQIERLEHLKAELLNMKDSKLRHKYIEDGFLAHNDPLCQLTTYHQMRRGDLTQIDGQKVLLNKMTRLVKLS